MNGRDVSRAITDKDWGTISGLNEYFSSEGYNNAYDYH